MRHRLPGEPLVALIFGWRRSHGPWPDAFLRQSLWCRPMGALLLCAVTCFPCGFAVTLESTRAFASRTLARARGYTSTTPKFHSFWQVESLFLYFAFVISAAFAGISTHAQNHGLLPCVVLACALFAVWLA